MPIRPANLATMSAAIAGAVSSAAPDQAGRGPVTVVYASGHHQTVEGLGRRALESGEGGVVAVRADSGTRYVLFADAALPPGGRDRTLHSGAGPVSFATPVRAGAIALGRLPRTHGVR
ncbi:hypothetical protein [Marinitenerispora sediminis]|uniref:Uncharacterized protein n=1 Tax=Marinitenerispora sediminis TaxID=1931232 RepID=A0A368SZL1_9ACTN|nr:hypothetical protein [Marinitenerispora sediminis]RCV48875.1 hypothetical protein DEF23_24365 [Marinitenerispora sediminis]RCV50847.1 hypothetical protein DEF24_23785 [Marinitenerispora sediminis]RCV57293.1 hypothetical protein DEF28_02070 [Marinitenerispora sediminis]